MALLRQCCALPQCGAENDCENVCSGAHSPRIELPDDAVKAYPNVMISFATFRTFVLGLFIVVTTSGFGGIERSFAPKAKAWDVWRPHDAAAEIVVDHGDWQAFLDRYVASDAVGVNRLAYGRVSEGDRAILARYIDSLAASPVRALSRPEQKAFWINLYNAVTVQVVLAHYPVRSILDIDTSPGILADGPWDEKLVTIEGERLSLNDIEHRILRPIFDDNRIHFAVNCASVGCPNLLKQVYTSDNVEALLSQAARAYVNDPRGARVDGGRLTVSKIFDWYADDFGGSEVSVIAYIDEHADPSLKAAIAGRRGSIKTAYDWALNDDPPVPSPRRSR